MFSTEITIGKQKIGAQNPVYFIADIAANHDGSLERAKELIYKAKEAGADCAKFQHFLADKIVSSYGFENLKAQSHQSAWKKSVHEIFDEYHCKREWTEELVKTCKEVNIEFMTTPYDTEVVDMIDKYVNAYKIGSGDITWHEFLIYLAKKQKPLLLATGASILDEVFAAINLLNKYTKNIVLMQCNTNYTASLENFKYINLNVLKMYRRIFPQMILGLSDHTKGDSTVLGAVALGAKVIEKHFTDDNNRLGPDHKFAMNPISWKEMVERSRELELALGDGIKKVEENEQDTVVVQRRAIRLTRNKKKGEILSLEDIEMLRPCPEDAYNPSNIQDILGKTLSTDKELGDCIYKNEIDFGL